MWSGCRSLKCFISLMHFLPFDVARLSAVMKRAHLQLSDHAARTGLTGSSVPPGLKDTWYRDVFIFLVPTWYRSTGSFDNTNLYLTLNYGTASEHLDFDFMVLYNAFVLSWGLTITQNSIHTISDLDRSRLSDTRSAENDRIGADTDPEYRIDASLVVLS